MVEADGKVSPKTSGGYCVDYLCIKARADKNILAKRSTQFVPAIFSPGRYFKAQSSSNISISFSENIQLLPCFLHFPSIFQSPAKGKLESGIVWKHTTKVYWCTEYRCTETPWILVSELCGEIQHLCSFIPGAGEIQLHGREYAVQAEGPNLNPWHFPLCILVTGMGKFLIWGFRELLPIRRDNIGPDDLSQITGRLHTCR